MYLHCHYSADGVPLTALDYEHPSDLYAGNPVLFLHSPTDRISRRDRAILGEKVHNLLEGAQAIFLPDAVRLVAVTDLREGAVTHDRCYRRKYRVADVSAVPVTLTGPIISPVSFQRFAARFVLRSPWAEGRPLLMMQDPIPDGMLPEEWQVILNAMLLQLDQIAVGRLAGPFTGKRRPFLTTGGLRIARADRVPVVIHRVSYTACLSGREETENVKKKHLVPQSAGRKGRRG